MNLDSYERFKRHFRIKLLMINNTMTDKQNTITEEIKTLFNEGLTTEQIKKALEIKGIIKNNHYIRNITYRLRVREGLVKPLNESNETVTDKAIIIKLYQNEQNNLILYVKTCLEFEEYLKANKELKTTSNLWNKAENGKYYHLRLDNDCNLDDINQSVFRGYNKIALNRAILRVKGISEGLIFDLGQHGLISEDTLKVCVKNFIKVYSEFYNKEILNKKIEITGEVITQ